MTHGGVCLMRVAERGIRGTRPALAVLLCIHLSISLSPQATAAQGSGGIHVNVIQGSGQTFIIGSGATKDLVVEVVDSSDKPVPNANVSFILGAGGTTFDGLSSLVLITDSQGRATARIRATGQSGPWSVRVTASYQQQTASASVPLTNATEAPKPVPVATAETPGTPGAAAPDTTTPASSAPSSTPTAKKSNKTLLIVLIVAAAAGGGLAAALGSKGSSSSGSGGGGTGGGTTPAGATITISGGTGGFGSPSQH